MGVALVGKVARWRSTSGRGTGSDRSRRHGSVEDSRTGIGRVVSSVSVEIGTLPDAALVAEHEERKLAAAMGPRARAAKLRNAAKRKKYAEQDDYVQAAPAASVERDVGDLVARVIDVAGDDRAGAVTSASPPRSTIQAPAARLSSTAPPPPPPPRTPPVVIVAEVAAPVVAAPAPALVSVARAAPGPPPEATPDLPPTTLGRFSLLQQQLQALDAAAAAEALERDAVKKQLRDAKADRATRTAKAKSLRREAALAAVAAKRLELARADEELSKAETASRTAKIKLEVLEAPAVLEADAARQQALHGETVKLRNAQRSNAHDAALAAIAAETAQVALTKLELENDLASLQLQRREADRYAHLSTARLVEEELGDDQLSCQLVTSSGLAALPPDFPGDEDDETGLERAMAASIASSEAGTPRAKTERSDFDPETDAEGCIASFDERLKALEADRAASLEEVKWADTALNGIQDVLGRHCGAEASEEAALARATKKDLDTRREREEAIYGFGGIGEWDPRRGALVAVVRGLVIELEREFVKEVIGEVATENVGECSNVRALLVKALDGLVDERDLLRLEAARSDLLRRNASNGRAVATAAARRLADIEPTLLFLPGFDGGPATTPNGVRPGGFEGLRVATGAKSPPPRPRRLQLGEPVSSLCCARCVTITDDEAATVLVGVGGRCGTIAVGSVAHRRRYVDEDEADAVVASIKDEGTHPIISLAIGRRRRRLCAVDTAGVIRVWRLDLSAALQVTGLHRETRFDLATIRRRCRDLGDIVAVQIDDDDESFKGEDAWIRRDDAPRLLLMDAAGAACRWQCLPAPAAPPRKRHWYSFKKQVAPEPEDRGVVLELLKEHTHGAPLCCTPHVSVDANGLVAVWPPAVEADDEGEDWSVQRRFVSVEPDVLGKVVVNAPATSDRESTLVFRGDEARRTALEACLAGDGVAPAAPGVHVRDGRTFSATMRDGALVALHERAPEPSIPAEVVAAALAPGGVVVLCQNSGFLSAAVVECSATSAPRVDSTRTVSHAHGVHSFDRSELNVASCAGRVFIRLGPYVLAFSRGRKEFEVRVGEGCALAAADPGIVAAASGEEVAIFDVVDAGEEGVF